jgi:hypothetical protein
MQVSPQRFVRILRHHHRRPARERPHLAVLHVYDNSDPADAEGQASPLLVPEMDRQGIRYPRTPKDLEQVPGWAKPIVMGALQAQAQAPRWLDVPSRWVLSRVLDFRLADVNECL